MTDTSWSETVVTWNEQPEIDGDTVDELGEVTSSTWYEVDVTALVIPGDGTYSIAGSSSRGLASPPVEWATRTGARSPRRSPSSQTVASTGWSLTKAP